MLCNCCCHCKCYVIALSLEIHPHAKGIWNKSFPHYDEFSTIFGKDRAT